MSSSKDVEAFLPLATATFHVLIALRTGDRHGYGIMQEVEARTGGAVRMSAGTLYRTVHRMLEQGLVEEPQTSLGIANRRRPYRITPFGIAVARAESNRLAGLVRMAQGAGLLAEPS